MDKRVFLAHLKLELRGLPDEEIAKTIHDYEQYFHEVTVSGMNEQEAVEKLGDPREIAAKIKREERSEQSVQKNDSVNVIVAIALLLFNLIFVLGPVIGIVGFVFGLFVMSGAFIVSPILTLIAMVTTNKHLFELFFSLLLAGIGLLLLPLLIKGSKVGFELLEKYAHWNVKQMRGERS